jgi:GT2 family glycosyltransferase
MTMDSLVTAARTRTISAPQLKKDMCDSSVADRKPRVCVLVISWNGKEHLRHCLRALLQQDYPACHVWVLENASTDGSAEMVRDEFSSVRVIRFEKNLGYTGAGNVGISRACAENYEYIVILAYDIVLDPRCLSGAVEAARSNPTVGMIGFRMFGGTSYVPYEEFERASRNWVSLDVEETKAVEGAAFLANPSVIERLGGYDETLFMYGDEDDLEARLVRAGYKLLRTNVPAFHNTDRPSTRGRMLWGAFYTHRNTLILLTKHESLKRFLRQALGLIRLACDPFRKIPCDNVVMCRYRPSNVLVNGLVVLAAHLSYAWNLPTVLRMRRKHRDLIARERALRSWQMTR